VPLLAYQGDWRRAGEAAYSALDAALVSPIDELAAVIAIRRHARLTGQYARAIAALQKRAGVTWDNDMTPRIPPRPGLRAASLGLADMLQADGQQQRARALLDRLIAQMAAELRAPDRSVTWHCYGMGVALALRGQPALALDWLRRGVENGALAHDDFLILQADPAFDGLRSEPVFVALERDLHMRREREAQELEQLRAAGQVPRRE
jgi:tetratricopeptide (TPR) repeat protein